MLLALFAVLFGTRHADATEHQDGLVLAVAVESVVKLAAFLAVGLLVDVLPVRQPRPASSTRSPPTPTVQEALDYRTSLGTWLVLTTLSGFAIIMLPRQFYVTIVENRSESELSDRDLGLPALSRGDQPVRPADRLRRRWRWSATAPAPTSTCCRCRCSTATTSSPWPPSSAACRRRPPW